MPLIFFLLAFTATLALGQPANTFFSTFDAERGNTFAPARDGNIWLGGMKDERVLLVKMTTGGNVLDKHTLDFKGNGFDSESLVEIFEDSDGSIVGCGNFETDNLGRGFVFRYNPSSRTVLWARIVRSESYNVLYGITPIGPNGDYLLYGSPQFANIDDAELLRLDRATGQVKLVQRFGLKGPDQLNRIIYHKGALYGCGRFSNGLGFNFNNNTRHALCKLDTATLKPLWTRIGPLASSKEAQLQGRDILVDNNTLISTFSGNATGTELTQSTIFLQKTDLNGKQLWVKQYNLPEWNSEFAETVVSVPDGYFLFGQDLLGDTSRLFLLKTDKQGNPLRAVKIDFYANDELAQIAPRAAILPTGNGLFFTATSQNQSGQFQAILGKTDFDGRLESPCAFLKSTPVNLQPFPNPVSELVVPEPSTGTTQLTPIIPSLENPDVEFSPKCISPGTCPNLPDLRLRMDSIRCTNGEARLYYSFCNTGAQEYTGSAFFGLYHKNPFKEKAQLITTIIHTGNKLLPGDCVQGSVSSSFTPPDVFKLDTFKHLYALMGINLNTKTPIKISDFPFAPNAAECGYFNNLDSLSVPEQLCKKGKGQPDVTLRVNRTFCSADSTLFFKAKVCNLGDSTVNGPISFAFYDKNPLKEKANAVWSTTVSQILAPGECKEQSLPLPSVALAYTKLYSLIGAGGNIPTPISLTDFPLPQSPVESDYLNNLDSFVVKAPECSDCERPTTFIKSMGVANKEELLQSMCVASDGYVYMVGRQSDNGLIAKMNPNGEILWVRKFKPPGQTLGNLDFVQVIEDSEGYLLITGTTNHSVNTREAMAMRYDVNADKVLWYQHYPDLNPEIMGVLEKPSGGNFVLFGYSEELFGSGFFTYYKTRSHIWEISRSSGEVVPALSTIFNGEPSTYLNDLVLHKGHFYGVGGWANRDIPNSSRGMLMKLSASDGTLEWMQGTLADTAADVRFFQPSRILADDEQLVVLGTAIQDFNLPSQQNFLYLSKYDLEGKLLWIKRYPSNFRHVEMISVPDGYAVLSYGFQQGSIAKWQILKLGKNGEVTAAKEFDGPSGSSGAGQFFNQSQLVQLPNHLLMGNQFKAGTFTDMILVKTDLDLQIADSCGLVRDLNISPQNVSATTNPLFSPSEPYWVEAVGQTTNFVPDSLVINPLCPVCPCTDKPDIALKSIEVLCTPNGGAKVNFQVCNQGFVSAPQGFDLTFYDKNPLTEAATPLFSLNVEAKPGFADCVPFSVELDANLLTFKKIYAMAGVWNDVATPLLLKEFPYADAFEECDYANNLDSITLALPPIQKLDLGPDRNICVGQSVTLDAGPGYTLYQWQGGPTTQTYTVSDEGTYILRVGDACGRTQVDTVRVRIVPQPTLTQNITLLPGKSVVIKGITYKQATTFNDTIPSLSGFCDTIVSYNIRIDTLHCAGGAEAFYQVNHKDKETNVGFVLLVAKDGSIYTGGESIEDGKQAVWTITKTKPNGEILWVRKFGSFNNRYHTNLIEDSEGNLFGTLSQKEFFSGSDKVTCKVFRYNPNTDQMLWMIDVKPEDGTVITPRILAEKTPGGNYILCYSLYVINLGYNSEYCELDRNSGQIIVGSVKQYGPQVNVFGGLVNQNKIILNGRIGLESVTVKAKDFMATIDLASGNVLEKKALINTVPFTPIGGPTALDDDGNIVTLMNSADQSVYLRKNTLDGTPLWIKGYSVANMVLPYTNAASIAVLSDGYALLFNVPIQNGQKLSYVLIKTDKNGLVQWSKKFAVWNVQRLSGPQSMKVSGDNLYITGTTEFTTPNGVSVLGTLLLKVDKDGNAGDNCDVFEPIPITQTDYSIKEEPADIKLSNKQRAWVANPNLKSTLADLNIYTLCSRCAKVVTTVDITCPADLTVTLPPNTSSTVVDYNPPKASTDCPDKNIAIKLIQGLGIGGSFPIGVNTECYEASNACGAKDTCCFKVTVVNPETPCDFKTGPNCMRYELLSVKFDAKGQRRYRVRLSNTCASPVQFVYIQSPNGVNAVSPAGGSVYTTTPAGRAYDVRNPNASPFASIRFKAQTSDLKSGASDIFEYTLPQQFAPNYILVAVRLENGDYYETYLNMFNCPAQPYDGNRGRENEVIARPMLYPNPTNGILMIDFGGNVAPTRLHVLNALGQKVYEENSILGSSKQLQLPDNLIDGLYYLRVLWPDGAQATERFVLKH